MATIRGYVRAGIRPLRNLLVEAYSVPTGYESHLPHDNHPCLSNHPITRLGSAVTSEDGEFCIEWGFEGLLRLAQKRNYNLWLTVSATCTDSGRPEFVYQDPIVRHRASDHEEYSICIADDYADASNPIVANEEAISAQSIKTDFEQDKEIDEARDAIARERIQVKEARRATFKTKFNDQLIKRVSLVERNEDGKAVDPFFIESDAEIRTKSESKTKERVKEDLASTVVRSNRLAFKGRISLTPDQVNALEARKVEEESDDDSIAISEDDFYEVVAGEDGDGLNPETDAQLVSRTDAIKEFCLFRTSGDECLKDLLDPKAPEEGDPPIEPDAEQPIEEPQDSDDEDVLGGVVSAEQLKGNLPSYVASVLDEQSVLDPANSNLPGPGDRLSEGDIRETSFPSLTLPPGPADVPAFYDFNDLQIAFRPVWQEALDESLLGDAEAIYDKYVEGGGSDDGFMDFLLNGNFSFTATILSTPIDVAVQRHVEVDNKEWAALSATQQKALSQLAREIDRRFRFLYQAKLQGNTFTDGLTDSDLNTFNRTKEYVMTRVNELREQAERIVASARKEVERQAAGKSIVPNSGVLAQLRNRLNSAYPGKYFAASKAQRSVNFGLLLTYRQRWTPTAYQVGELIKSIPLAPKEVRKYSKKTVRKQRRSQKEIETNIESLKSETDSKTRAEAQIVQEAQDKTNFNASANGSFSVGVWSGGGSSSLTQDSAAKSAETKKRMHESVVKAAREYRNELKVELETEESFEEEFQESGEIMNPNDELTVTYLFYELQRRYKVQERLQRMTSVVLVAQEMPKPHEIDEDWLIAHRWILNRVLLDDALKQPLTYVAEALVAAQFALEEARKSLEQQRRIVEELKEDVSDSRNLTESRYAALQRSMERSARATQRKKKGGGLFGFAKKLTSATVVGSIVDRFIPGESESPEAARVREAAAQDAYEREMQKLRDLEAQLAQMNASLSAATEEFSDRLAEHLGNVVQVTELRNHVKDNISHYMQAIWMHEPFQQRWLRLKDVPVPVLERKAPRMFKIKNAALTGSLSNVAHLGTAVYEYEVWPEIDVPTGGDDVGEGPALDTIPLYQVADIDDLIGFRANYMIFPMLEANALTDFMMEPYIERAAGAFGITDPDEYGNMNLDDFTDYVCCLKEHLNEEEFDELVPELTAQLKKLLQSPLRDDEEIVVPMDAMYIEALPGTKPILEDFKLLHRQIDAADAQEDLRLKKMEKLRYAQRLLEGRTDDPASDARYEFTHNPDLDFSVTGPSEGGGGGE